MISGYVFHDTNGPNHGQTIDDLVVFLEINLYGHPLAGLMWERQFEEVLLKLGWEKAYQQMWMTSTWLETSRKGSHVEELSEEC